MEEEIKSWEQLPDENDEMFTAFLSYLNLSPSERTLLRAQQRHQQRTNQIVTKTVSKQWMQWSRTYHWSKRAAEYDEQTKIEIEKYVEFEQIGKLVKYRQAQHTLATEINDVALLLIDRARQRLMVLNIDEIAARDIPQYVKAAAMIAELASDAEARALLLQDIVQHYKENFNEYDARNANSDDDEEFILTEIG